MKILIFGSNGLLGTYLTHYLNSNKLFCVPLTRQDYDIESNKYSNLEDLLISKIDSNSIIINCAAAIPQKDSPSNLKKYISVNTLFPNILSKLCEKYNIKLIHITTDGVFLGDQGGYTEEATHDAQDIYGVSKSLGENINACIIRTSIIGEFYNGTSFINWILENNNGSIDGYKNYYWNGITCLQLSEIIYDIIINNKFWNGVRHLFGETISKYELIDIIRRIYKLNINLLEKPNYLDRSLRTIYDKFEVAPIFDQIYKMKIFFMNLKCKIGKYINLYNCRYCGNQIIDILHLGDTIPLAGGFMRDKSDFVYEKVFPLTLSLCEKCKYMQCKQVIDPDVIFKSGYFYYSSMIKSLVDHFTNLAESLYDKYKPTNRNVKIIEIGCNDGVLLNPLYEKDFYIVGVDPSDTVKKISEKYHIYNDYFTDDLANKIIIDHGQFDIFISANSFAHINNMQTVINGLKKVLKPDGLAIIEVHYSKTIFTELNFDFIYHEHMSYYTVSSFYYICKNNELYLEDVEFIKTHGGSIRLYIKNAKNDIKNVKNDMVNQKIYSIMEEEKNIFDLDYLKKYVSIIINWKNKFMSMIYYLKSQNKKIYGYGCSGRATILRSFCGLELDGMCDDAKSKIGSYTPVFHDYIASSDILNIDKPDYVVILAWPYADGIIKQHVEYLNNQIGGKFIIPLPEIKII
jgi:methylation protein EvaC